MERVQHAVSLLEWIVAKESSNIMANGTKAQPASGCAAAANVDKMLPVNTDEEKPETPTDVQDVKF